MADIQAAINTAVAFDKKWEGLYSGSPSSSKKLSDSVPSNTQIYSYYDSIGGVWTIGWGSTYYTDGTSVSEGDIITKADADALITWEMTQKEAEVSKFIDSSSLNNNEYAAILSIAYNAGAGGLKNSGIPDSIKKDSRADTANIIKTSIVTAQGVPSKGLKNRRIDESKLFLGQYNEIYSLYLRNSGTVNLAALGIVIIGITLYFRKRLKK